MKNAIRVVTLLSGMVLFGSAAAQYTAPSFIPSPPFFGPTYPLLPPHPTFPQPSGAQTSTSCANGLCKVTINGVTKTYPGTSASVSVRTVNGVTSYVVTVDGKVVPF